MCDISSLSGSTTLVAEDYCLSTTIDDEAVILNTDEGMYYGFNEVGTFIWEELQTASTVEELCQAVVAEFDVTQERCRGDVEQLVSELAERELIRLVD